jgi:DNA-binding NarL/FixJ family response regulator
VIAVARNGIECMQLLEKGSNPDIILMDIKMQGISGIEATRLISEKYPQVKVIMLTIYTDEHYVSDAINAGAKGFVLKNVKRDELVSIINHVMNDGAFLDPSVTACILGYVKSKKDTGRLEKAYFTYRELEIAKEIIAGNKDNDIARNLYLSKHTVRTHMKNIFRKLGVSSRSQAAIKIMNLKIINPD